MPRPQRSRLLSEAKQEIASLMGHIRALQDAESDEEAEVIRGLIDEGANKAAVLLQDAIKSCLEARNSYLSQPKARIALARAADDLTEALDKVEKVGEGVVETTAIVLLGGALDILRSIVFNPSSQ